MTSSLASFQPMMSKLTRRTPTPDETVTFADTEYKYQYSPTPGGADMSSESSPGSASDHMGVFPNGNPIQPSLYTGASVLAAFEASSHVNRVITTNQGSGTAETTMQKNSVVRRKDPPASRRRAKEEGGTTNRRQKRLQRNRESARLSRRRRKQYLEVLEERVDKMSDDLDSSRRQHITEAVSTIRQKRMDLLQRQGASPVVVTLGALETGLSRTSEELMVATTFQSQQLHSFSVPPSMQFILWLTLQSDCYFRGGRAASERLSAARIGERMLSSGTDCVAPSQSMWPLFCNEVGLSYDQEEKLRNFQRLLIQDSKSWLDRHTAFASRKVMQSAHDSVQALTLRAGQRERSTVGVLSAEQRIKLLAWSTRNRDRVVQSTAVHDAVTTANRTSPITILQPREISKQQHIAANLYILNERLQKVLQQVPPAAPLVTGVALKKLSHRPSFEPLGAADERGLCRENSFASSGSLKGNASEMSAERDERMEEDERDESCRPQIPPICPVDAQSTATPAIQQALGFVQDLLPVPLAEPEPPASMMEGTFAPFQSMVPTPIPVPSLVYQAPAAYTQSAPAFGALQQAPVHERQSSFLPVHLNVVPEEIWPEDEADEFLLDMIEGDWAIGEGIHME